MRLKPLFQLVVVEYSFYLFFLLFFFLGWGVCGKYQVYCCGGSKCPDFLSLWTRTLVTVDASVLLIYYFIDPFSNELCGT